MRGSAMGEPLPDFRVGLDRPINEGLALAGRLILIVEDEPLIAADIALAFEEVGAMVTIARDHAKARELLEHTAFSCAIVDCGQSREESEAFCKQLKGAGIPCLIYSGSADAGARGNMFLPKPSSVEEIVAAITGLINTRSTVTTPN